MRFRNLAVAVLIIAAVVLIGRRILMAVHRSFTPNGPVAARATPAAQNGFRLLAVQPVSERYDYTSNEPGQEGTFSSGGNSSSKDLGVWISMDTLPNGLLTHITSTTMGSDKYFAATGRTSNGESLPLAWEAPSGSSGPKMLLVSIPTGYPDACKWINVSVDDKQGHTATWRIEHLPPSQHVLSPPVALQKTFAQKSIRVTAHAWRGYDRYAHANVIKFSLKGDVPPHSHQWETWITGYAREWEPSGFVEQTGRSEGFGTVASRKNGKGAIDIGEETLRGNGSNNYMTSLSYLADNHFLRLHCEMEQFETYHERVTFHNIPLAKNLKGIVCLAPSHALSQTTPSGITVTLPAGREQEAEAFRNNFGSEGMAYPGKTKFAINYLLRLDPSNAAASLPRSPLSQKFHKPVTITASLAEPLQESGSYSQGGHPTVHNFHAPGGTTTVLKDFPIVVQQQCDLQVVPMTFTLPIEDRKPKK